jgi:hypothetical protein
MRVIMQLKSSMYTLSHATGIKLADKAP